MIWLAFALDSMFVYALLSHIYACITIVSQQTLTIIQVVIKKNSKQLHLEMYWNGLSKLCEQNLNKPHHEYWIVVLPYATYIRLISAFNLLLLDETCFIQTMK